MTRGVSPFAAHGRELFRFSFYSNPAGNGYRIPGVALSSCFQQLFSAKAAYVYFFPFFMEYKIKGTVRLGFRCV